MQLADALQMRLQIGDQRLRQHRSSVLAALAVADEDFTAREIQIMVAHAAGVADLVEQARFGRGSFG